MPHTAHRSTDRVDSLAGLRQELVREAGRLYFAERDAALLWAGSTLSELLKPEALHEGLNDWVLDAALEILLETTRARGEDDEALCAARHLLIT